MNKEYAGVQGRLEKLKGKMSMESYATILGEHEEGRGKFRIPRWSARNSEL